MDAITILFVIGVAFGAPITDVTYSNDVKPILDGHCIECHHTGGHFPQLSQFPFVAPNNPSQEQIATQVSQISQPQGGMAAKMPPGARTKLSVSEVAMIKKWLDQGLKP